MATLLTKIQPTTFQRFFRTEAAGGLILLLFGFAALALANSPFAESILKMIARASFHREAQRSL